jgi:hypothetical protein
MRTVAVVTFLFVLPSLCGCSGGRGGIWCAHYGTGLNDCSFYSFEQCQASVRGNGGTCARNPFVNAPSALR